MIKFFCAVILALALATGNAQQKYTSKELSEILPKKNLQCSGITYASGKLYIVSEKCGAVYVTDSKKAIEVIILKNLPEQSELEAIALYNDTLYLLDEKGPNIYTADLKGEVVNKYPVYAARNYNPTVTGYEAMAINTTQKLLYIQNEKGHSEKANQSLMYIYNLNNLSKPTQALVIDMPKGYRTTDMFYDNNNGKPRLALLITDFTNDKTPANYKIYYINLDLNGIPVIDKQTEQDVSNYINAKPKATNAEGITVDENHIIYIVNDNDEAPKNCDNYNNTENRVIQLTPVPEKANKKK